MGSSSSVTVKPAEGLHGRCCREKESGGALDIPGGNKLIELEYAQVEDRKLRGQLRNVSKLELLVRLFTALPLLLLLPLVHPLAFSSKTLYECVPWHRVVRVDLHR